MRNGWDWRWFFRRECGAIASTASTGNELQIHLCNRWRWHRGKCRP